ncbi:MAG: TonB-dependent receptor [Candidatus Aminicenantes bacterium]|nr:MAG: TonB-dependent receptor [Candidatus Aminicenantes bacterium]
MKKFLTVLGAMLILTMSFSYAQEQAGQLFGTVTDEEKAPLPGVTIEGTSPKLMGKVTTVTDEMGRFRLINLRPGTYTIVFTLPGFATLRRERIIVGLGRTYYLNVSLRPAVIEEEITVIGESPMVDIKASGTTIEISREMFNKLPKGRNFTSVVTFATGVNDELELLGISMDGASSSENVFFIDGVNTTHLLTGDTAQQVVFEFIDEVQVKSSGYEAEYGGSMGGVINVITRAGGNEFHGELMGYYNGGITNGAYNGSPGQTGGVGAHKVLRINPLDNTIGEHVTYPEDTWHNYEFGFGIGGYVIKDKLWFFGSFLPTIRSIDRDAEFISDPTKNATFNQKKTWYRASAKITAQPLAALRLSASFAMDPYKWRGDLPALDGSGNPDKEWSTYGYDYPGITFAGRADYIASDNIFFSATGGFFRTNTKQLIGPTEPRWFHQRTNAGLPGVTPDLEVARGWYNYGYYDGYQTLFNILDRITSTLDGTFYFDLGGEHVFKAGVQFERIHHDVNDAYPFTYYRLYWGDDYSSPNLGLMPTTFGYLEARWPFGEVAEINSNRWAVFLQDSWTVGNKLTLNLGLRFEKEDIPSYADEAAIAAAAAEDPPRDIGKPPVAFDFFEKIAPRFGFAYDVFGDADLKVFGSIGIYYDVMKLEMAEGSYGGFKWLSSYYDMTTVNWPTFGHYDHPVTDGSFLPYYETRNWRIPSYGTTQPDTGPDKMKPYSKIEYTLGVQKRLGEDVSLTARFLHNRILWAIEDIGVETPEGEQYFNGNPGSDWVNTLWDVGYWPTPKAKRNYYSLDVGIDKRFSNNWMAGVHYTWSYLWGNFSGLASSDEQGRKSPNVERYFDAWFMHYDQNGNESTGKLPTDRPHSIKAYGAYTFDFGLTVGSYFSAMSGTPKSVEFELNNIQGYYPIGRGTEGRNPLLWRVDLYAEYNIKLTDRYAFQINLNVDNVFNTHIATRHFHLINQEDVYTSDAEKLAGFDYLEVMTTNDVLRDPRYMKKWSFQGPINARIGVKFLF